MSGAAPYGYRLEPTVVDGIRTKMMVADPETADLARLMLEMYAEPETSFGDIAWYFAEQDIKMYAKDLTRGFLSQLLRNPVYAEADLELCEFFKSQGAAIINDPADFAGTNGCYGNAVAGNFFSCLKCERCHLVHFDARVQTGNAVFSYIDSFYNTFRPLSPIAWIPPNEYGARVLSA